MQCARVGVPKGTEIIKSLQELKAEKEKNRFILSRANELSGRAL